MLQEMCFAASASRRRVSTSISLCWALFKWSRSFSTNHKLCRENKCSIEKCPSSQSSAIANVEWLSDFGRQVQLQGREDPALCKATHPTIVGSRSVHGHTSISMVVSTWSQRGLNYVMCYSGSSPVASGPKEHHEAKRRELKLYPSQGPRPRQNPRPEHS